MQREVENHEGGFWPEDGYPEERCTSSVDGMAGCSTVRIDSPGKSTATCKSAPPALGARSGDGKTRKYFRSSEPRLKWTDELHDCFLRAIVQLGGAEKATPKAILKAMDVRWLKIAHVKSHLQMFRNPKSGRSCDPQSDFTFCQAERPEDPEAWNSQMICTTSHINPNSLIPKNRQVESEPEASWRSLTRGATPPKTLPNIENSSARQQYNYSSGDFSSCSFDSSAQFNQICQFSNISLSPDLETPDDVDDRRQLLSDQLLACGADATRLYESAELLHHNLLMAVRERRLLETGVTQSHAPPDTHDGILPDLEVPLDLTMSVGMPDHHPDVRPEILTLDLTRQLNRPHL